uniref:(northern house mosquito) hypothetical protein n=1 Tax=Culex pipiens TaxID=7175 RepID=A0A8D8FYL4_CULPI
MTYVTARKALPVQRGADAELVIRFVAPGASAAAVLFAVPSIPSVSLNVTVTTFVVPMPNRSLPLVVDTLVLAFFPPEIFPSASTFVVGPRSAVDLLETLWAFPYSGCFEPRVRRTPPLRALLDSECLRQLLFRFRWG